MYNSQIQKNINLCSQLCVYLSLKTSLRKKLTDFWNKCQGKLVLYFWKWNIYFLILPSPRIFKSKQTVDLQFSHINIVHTNKVCWPFVVVRCEQIRWFLKQELKLQLNSYAINTKNIKDLNHNRFHSHCSVEATTWFLKNPQNTEMFLWRGYLITNYMYAQQGSHFKHKYDFKILYTN